MLQRRLQGTLLSLQLPSSNVAKYELDRMVVWEYLSVVGWL